MRAVVGLLAALVLLLPPKAALALDYRVAGDNPMGLGLIDADTVTRDGSRRRFSLTVIFAEHDGEPSEIGVATVLIDCDRARYRIESVISYDLAMKETSRETSDGGWSIPEEGTPFFPASEFVCRGGALPRPDAQELKDIVAGFLLRQSGATSI